MNPKVDDFINNADKWQEEFRKLRSIVQQFGLEEELKWGVPCYALNGNNVVLIHGFKEYCALLFVKGSLFSDPFGILFQQTVNVQAGRQVRFSGLQEIEKLEDELKVTMLEAIEVEKSGRKVEFKETAEFDMPEELRQKFDELPGLKTAFEALTPGRQRAYLLHFGQPKQAKTREARIEKYIPMIFDGKGLND